MEAPAASRWRADLALAGVTVIWGSTFVLIKEALENVSPLLFLALRFTIAAGVLGVTLRGRYGRARWDRRQLLGGCLVGICLFAGYAFQTVGLSLTTPSKSAFLTGLYIVLVPILGSLVYRNVPRLSEALGVVVATVGMGMMSLTGDSTAVEAGDLLTVCCALAFAFHILLLGHFSRGGSFELLSLLQVGVSALLALGTFWWMETPLLRWSPAVLAAVGVTSLLATALAFTVQSWAQRHTSATHTALIFSLEPVFAGLTSYLVTGEVLSPRAALGAGLILGGILLVEMKPRRRSGHALI